MIDLLRGYKWNINKYGEPFTNTKINGVAYRLPMKNIIFQKELSSKKKIFYKNNNPLDNRINNLTYCKNKVIVKDDYALIMTTDETKVECRFKIDIDMIDKVTQYSWTYKEGGYLFRKENKKTKFLHNLIMEVDDRDKNFYVDHINRDSTDNRKSNLRICTSQQNQYNKSKPKIKNPTSKYKGVSWCINKGCWRVRVSCEGKEYLIGYYSNEEAAANKYNEVAKRYHGTFASLNDVVYMDEKEVDSLIQLNKRVSHTKYTGVTFHKHSGNWIACFYYKDKYIHIGSFKNELDAAKAYNKKVLEMGIDRKLNDILN